MSSVGWIPMSATAPCARAMVAKDHQAHLTAWKARQANRYAEARRGEEPAEMSSDEIQAINTEQQAARAGWDGEAISKEADDVSERLIGETSATDPEALAGSEAARWRNVRQRARFTPSSTSAGSCRPASAPMRIGSPPIWTRRSGSSKVEDCRSGMRQPRPTTSACFQALAGRLDDARPLLRRAFQLNPELADWARQDTDLTALWTELDELTAKA